MMAFNAAFRSTFRARVGSVEPPALNCVHCCVARASFYRISSSSLDCFRIETIAIPCVIRTLNHAVSFWIGMTGLTVSFPLA
jgi:hypothetical protein